MAISEVLAQVDAATLAAWTTVIVTLVGVIVALWAVHWQMQKQWLLHSANLVTTLVDRFESDEWKVNRRNCAERLLSHQRGVVPLDLSDSFPVLSFLEHVAYLVRIGALDRMMVWNKFGWYVVGYCFAITTPENAIDAVRSKEKDPSVWEEFEWLYRDAVRIYRSRKVQIEDWCDREMRISQLIRNEMSLVPTSMSNGLCRNS